jgi:sugar phosphate isomerase/epimerase
MRIGAYTSALHDLPIEEVLPLLAEMGLDSAEVNAGGYLPAPHLPIERLLESQDARSEYLALFAQSGVTLTALNCNGDPLAANVEVRHEHAADLRRAIELAALLGVKRVVTMSGMPEAHAGGRMPSWPVLPWESVWLDVRDYQWDEVAIPFWRSIDELARDQDVKVAIEMHPGMLVYNPGTMERLADAISATHVGAEMDPSHLFWQGIDPIAAIEHLGSLVYNAAAKDTRINDAVKVYGVLDDRHQRVHPSEPGAISMGGPYTLSRWPVESSWEFVAVGRGHDVGYWSRFLDALSRVDPDMAVNIEHEDRELDQLEGFRFAARTLLAAAGRGAPGA